MLVTWCLRPLAFDAVSVRTGEHEQVLGGAMGCGASSQVATLEAKLKTTEDNKQKAENALQQQKDATSKEQKEKVSAPNSHGRAKCICCSEHRLESQCALDPQHSRTVRVCLG